MKKIILINSNDEKIGLGNFIYPNPPQKNQEKTNESKWKLPEIYMNVHERSCKLIDPRILFVATQLTFLTRSLWIEV